MESNSNMPTGIERGVAISCDVLIVGGGVAGLWILKDLRNLGYSALLLEQNKLGGAQTNHSHVYLHKGNLYRGDEKPEQKTLAKALLDVSPVWENWLATFKEDVRHTVRPSFYGWKNPALLQRKQSLWTELGLPYDPVDSLPAALSGGAISRAVQSHEFGVEGEWLVRSLAEPLKQFVTKVASIDTLRVNEATCEVESVGVIMAGGQPVEFRPRFVVLCAGRGNRALLEKAAGTCGQLMDGCQTAQQVRNSYMLVVRGPRNHLAPLTGIFPDIGDSDDTGLFIVAREEGEDCIWLVSDGRSHHVEHNYSDVGTGKDDKSREMAEAWVPRTLDSLANLSPCLRPDRRDLYQWGVYPAHKAERGRPDTGIPGEVAVEPFGLKSMLSIWPTKLTLAPAAAEMVAKRVREKLGAQGAVDGDWDGVRTEIDIAPELWKTLGLERWAEFARRVRFSKIT